jgi:formylglycine-generating enzyme required for sulfatase activity
MLNKFAVVCVALFTLSAAQAAEKGTVKIVTEPGEAQITVNGERKGTSPADVGQTFAIKLDQGDYSIEASKDGISEKKQVFVAEDTLQTLTFNLAAQPEMVNIPAGTFVMGCIESRDVVDGMEGKCSDNEKPAHKVSLSAFQMGKTEVTFDQWDACETAKACPHADDAGWGRGNRPVINVSWDDAQTYLKWLNGKTGKNYRLPTEAEWEYAARGGADSAYPWGNSISCSNAAYNGKDCGNEKTKPVGAYAANGYGLFDTVGNVWEWCQDSLTSSYGGRANGTYRVLRGGSWISSDAQNVRSADRDNNTSDSRSIDGGFRLAHS